MKQCSLGVGLCLESSDTGVGGRDSVSEVVGVERYSLLLESISIALVSILVETLVKRLVEMFWLHLAVGLSSSGRV